MTQHLEDEKDNRHLAYRNELDNALKKWLEDNGLKKRNGYIDHRFYKYCGLGREDKTLGYLYTTQNELLIERLIMIPKWSGYDDDTKKDMTSHARYKLLRYTFKSFKEDGNLFTYNTSIITSAFLEIIKGLSKYSNIVESIRENEGDKTYLPYIHRNIEKMIPKHTLSHELEIFRDHDYYTMLKNITMHLKETYGTKLKLNHSITIDKTVPKFKVKKKQYMMMINDVLLIDIYTPMLHNETLYNQKNTIQRNAEIARNNNYQYLCINIRPDIVNDDFYDMFDISIRNYLSRAEHDVQYVEDDDIINGMVAIDKVFIPKAVYDNLVYEDKKEQPFLLFDTIEDRFMSECVFDDEIEKALKKDGVVKVYKPKRMLPAKDKK